MEEVSSVLYKELSPPVVATTLLRNCNNPYQSYHVLHQPQFMNPCHSPINTPFQQLQQLHQQVLKTSSTSNDHHEDNRNQTHISSLYPEILAIIFSYLDVRDKGRAAQVCSSWRDAAYYKSVWWGIEAKLHLRRSNPKLFSSLVSRGVKKVQVLSLKRTLRDVIQGITNLESLNLSGCYNISDKSLTHAFVYEVPTLTYLDLSLCKQVTDASLGRLVQYLNNLEVLKLSGCCNVTNTGLVFISRGFPKLRQLNLRSCWHISDHGISYLSGFNIETAPGNLSLEYLDLQDCQRISDEGLQLISAGLTKLVNINLSFCVSITDSGLKYLAKMPTLRELNLRSCDNISDLGLQYLAEGGSRVTHLDVSFCDKIGDQALLHISQGLFNLKSLSLSACPISDSGLESIARTLHELEVLNIGQCAKVSDKGLNVVAESLVRLKCIDLYGCTKITTAGIERIMKLPQLSKLNLGLWHVR